MTERFEGCTLAIIAGGRGSRLGGVVKAHLRFRDGQTLLDRTCAILGPLVDRQFVVANDASLFPSCEVVSDVVPDRGAPGGVQAACAHARTQWVLALASDLPFVVPDVLGLLWQERAGADAIVARVEGRLQPLAGFYRSAACAGPFERRLRESEPSFATLLEDVRACVVDGERLRSADADLRSFINVNTPEELERAGLQLPTA